MQKNNQNTYSDDIFDDTLVFHHFQSNEKSSQNKNPNCFQLIASTGIEPVFPP